MNLRLRTRKEFKMLIDGLNFNIGLNLLKTRKSCHIKFKLELNEYCKNILVNHYNLCASFKPTRIMDELGLINENFYNANDTHRVRMDSFEIRLVNKKKISIQRKMRGELVPEKLFSNFFLSVRFWRQNLIVFNESELSSLVGGRNSYDNI